MAGKFPNLPLKQWVGPTFRISYSLSRLCGDKARPTFRCRVSNYNEVSLQFFCSFHLHKYSLWTNRYKFFCWALGRKLSNLHLNKALFLRFKTYFRISVLIKYGQHFGVDCQIEMSGAHNSFVTLICINIRTHGYKFFCWTMAGKLPNLPLKQDDLFAIWEKFSHISAVKTWLTFRCRVSNRNECNPQFFCSFHLHKHQWCARVIFV